jgi:hypothetical protein
MVNSLFQKCETFQSIEFRKTKDLSNSRIIVFIEDNFDNIFVSFNSLSKDLKKELFGELCGYTADSFFNIRISNFIKIVSDCIEKNGAYDVFHDKAMVAYLKEVANHIAVIDVYIYIA